MQEPHEARRRIDPVWELNDSMLSEIANLVDQKLGKATAAGLDEAKMFLNALFAEAQIRLHGLLTTREPASWILEAYKQLELWTAITHSELTGDDGFKAPIEL
jgi:hypothetical protein